MPSQGLARNGLHLAALCSFAIAWQYFQRLADGPDFFIQQGATATDVVVFALGLLIVPPAVLLGLEWITGLVSRRARDALHLVCVGGLSALIAWQAITDADPGARPALAFSIAAAIGAGVAYAYARVDSVRTWLTVLSAAPAVVLVLFLGFSPARTLAFGGAGPEPRSPSSSGAPVVMVVLDELPTTSLMDERGRIDVARYPGFAAFARDATWYRNAFTVADYTQLAVPALLTGKDPRPGAVQVAAEYPDNLFTLLGGSYRLNVFEALTDLCRAACERQLREPFGPRMRKMVSSIVETVPSLPPSIRGRLSKAISVDEPPRDASRSRRVAPDSVRRFLSTTQDVRFERFLDTLGQGSHHTLDFMHLLLPHRPWHYLPDGRRYLSPRSYRAGLVGAWSRDRRVVQIGRQRHQLQAAMVDRMLRRLVLHLKERGAYDRSLIVVAADHGLSFRPGAHARNVSRSTVDEIAPVPLLVKAPRQRRGRIDDSDVQSTDVLPTIAAHLGVDVPWTMDGVPAQTRPVRRSVTLWRHDDGDRLVFGRRDLELRRDAAVRTKLAMLGSNGDPYRIGPRPKLIGRRAQGEPGLVPARATLDAPGRYQSVDKGARSLPVDVTGEIHADRRPSRPLAIVVNGIVAATAWSIAGGDSEYFTSLVPPAALTQGRNRVRVLGIRAGGDAGR